ncbi:MAG: multidrug effflux MFS transporter [Burkholderiales bacterium]|nr:multidrug effflux MFS transporter [Burkholderiales bacterium]MDE2457150.1 multidrug effflux MFS transporter [Burkholderiales bacterium]
MSASSETVAARAAPRLTPIFAALAMALLLGLQPVTTDVYLPSLPALRTALGASMAGAQLTMSIVLLAFGTAQLVWGPVADRFGRRPVLLAGLGCFTLASLGAAGAESIEAFVGWRALQGACVAASVVVARAMVRDLYEPREGARMMALALTGLGLIACSGPLLGGWIAGAWGWRAVQGFVAAIGAGVGLFVWRRLPETLPPRHAPPRRPAELLRDWRAIVREPSFIAWTLLVSCSYGGLFTFLAGSSFVYIGMLGLGPAAYGAVMASASIVYMGGTLACRRWVAGHGTAGAVRRASWASLGAGVLLLAGVLAGGRSPWVFLLPQWLFCFGHGVHQACGQTGAVAPFPRSAGSASALAGFALALVAFTIGSWLGHYLANDPLPFALCFGFWAFATALVARTLVQRPAR